MGGVNCKTCQVIDTEQKAENLFEVLCAKYPDLKYCTIHPKNPIPSEYPQTALVIDTDVNSPTFGEGIAMMTPTGDIATLPEPVPEELTKLVPHVIDTESVAQLEGIPPPPPPPNTVGGKARVNSSEELPKQTLLDEINSVKLTGVSEENVRPSTPSERASLLEEIRKGMKLSKVKECPVDYYWDAKLKKCVMVQKSDVGKQTDNMLKSLEDAIVSRKYAMNPDENEEEWE